MPARRSEDLQVDASSPALNLEAGKQDSPATQEATQLRAEANVNSPRGQSGQKGFPQTSSGPPAGIMTQVSREDEAITNKQRQVTQEDRRCCSWLCCYSKPTTEPAAPDKEQGSVAMANNPRQAPPIVSKAEPAGGGPSPTEREESLSDSGPDPEGLLGIREKKFRKKKCLVLDLDETLVHSSFKPVPDADFIVPVEIDQVIYKVYVLKRPFVDEFLTEVAKDYEVVIFTASLSLYANPLLDMLDTHKVIAHRLFRESCVLHGQAYVKDMSKIGRKMKDIMIVDNSPLSYAFQPTSAIPITSWFDDRSDRQLRELLPVLQTTLKDAKDVRDILDANNKSFRWLCAQAKS